MFAKKKTEIALGDRLANAEVIVNTSVKEDLIEAKLQSYVGQIALVQFFLFNKSDLPLEGFKGDLTKLADRYTGWNVAGKVSRIIGQYPKLCLELDNLLAQNDPFASVSCDIHKWGLLYDSSASTLSVDLRRYHELSTIEFESSGTMSVALGEDYSKDRLTILSEKGITIARVNSTPTMMFLNPEDEQFDPKLKKDMTEFLTLF